MKKNLHLFLAISLSLVTCQLSIAQQPDSAVIKKFFNEALTNSKAYHWLDELVNGIGAGRLSGSPEAAKGVEFAKKAMKETGADTVWTQDVWVPHWVRGEKESAKIIDKGNSQDVPVTALGGSVGTPKDGITAQVIEVHTFDELKKLGKEKIQGNIVFYNHPFDQTFYNTFEAYSEAGKYRWSGPSEAARYGAVASVCRSMAQNDDDYPHTGAMGYNDSLPKIPGCAISTNAANLLSRIIHANPQTKFFMKLNCETRDSVLSNNVIGEIKGSTHPEEIIVVGGHLDSWETGKGANDDGSGVVQAMEVLRLFKTTGIRPARTIRAVAYMNEENGGRGGKRYADLAAQHHEHHIAAVESDAGSFTPYGFGLEMPADKKAIIQKWKPLFLPYHIWNFEEEHGGSDIGPLQAQGVPQIGLGVDSQRYFDIHHAATDTFQNVNRRELELGAAAMASIIFLISQNGL